MNHNISQKKIVKEYQTTKKIAENYLINKNIEKSLRYYKFAATIAWKYPILYDFIDEELEGALSNISNLLFKKENQISLNSLPDRKRIVLYSGQIIDKGGLTEQYLYALVNEGYDILLIVPDAKNMINGKAILKYIDSHSTIRLYTPKSNSLKKKIINIHTEILKFNPSKVFLHFLPNDVEGYCAIFGLNFKKFYIVHNDHTFWIGKNCSDFFIEFRNFGVSLSYHRRKIPAEKILKIPYYPITETTSKFDGFPFESQNKIIGVSGANLNKYYMDPKLKYFHAIKELIRENDNFIFCLCGWGDKKPIEQFIIDNNLENKFYFLGRRNDFSMVISHSDILFESYPFKGGLVMLFGTNYKKPIVGIADETSPQSSLEEFLSIKNYIQPNNIEDFKKEATKLIQEQSYRDSLGNLLADNKFTKSCFTESVQQLLKDDIKTIDSSKIGSFELDDKIFLERYIYVYSSLSIDFWKLQIIKGKLSLKQRTTTAVNILFNDKSLNIKKITKLFIIIMFGYQK